MNEHEILKRIIPYVPPYWVWQAFADPDRTLVGREERIYAAVLFVDISGFTTIAEALSRKGREGVEELSALLDRYFGVMSKPVVALGGTVVKFAGDALIVTFPAQPDGGDAHLGAALHCALRMQDAMSEFEQVHTSAGVFPLRMKIGIGEGAIYNTTVGDENKEMQPVFAGRPLARCQQAEDRASPGEIVADAALINRMPGHLDIGEARDTFRPIHGATNVPTLPPVQLPDVAALKPEQAATLIRRLSPYLPRQLVERIHQGQRSVYGEHRWVTVMFVKFGGLNYDWEPQVGEVLQIYYTTMRDCILRYGGRLNEIDISASGGVLVVYFGAPTAYEDGEQRAVSCAWDMQQAVVNVRMRAGAAAERLKQCIGISSNIFFVGDVGAPVRRTYTAVGDEVNLASRLMDLAEWGEVVVTRWVQKRATGRFDFEAMGHVQVKGKIEPVPTFILLAPRMGASDDDLGSLSIADRQSLFGRRAEMDVLKKAKELAWRGRPQLLSISGQAGVGKSRLAGELIQLWTRDGGLAYTGESRQRGDSKAYGSWAKLLRAIFDLQEAELERHREKVQSQLGLFSSELPGQADLFLELMGLLEEREALPQAVLPEQRRLQLHHQVTDLFIALARRQPLLLVLDDAQEIDQDSVALLNDLANRAGNAPLLICVLYRPTTTLAFTERIATTQIVLRELDQQDSLALARQLLQDAGLLVDLAPRLVGQAQGNPFYLHKMVRAILESGNVSNLVSDVGFALDADAIPEEIVELIQSQVDHLDEDCKLTLRIAAVIGRHFAQEVLQIAHPIEISPADLQVRLKKLERAQIIQRNQAGDPKTYFFGQEMTRKVIYARLLSLDRERFHRQVAKAMEKAYAGALPVWNETIADHFGRGNEWDKAAFYLLEAGQQAANSQDYAKALSLYDRAAEMLELCETDPDFRSYVYRTRLELLFKRGDVRRKLLQMLPALEDYEQAAHLAGTLADLDAQGRALSYVAEIRFRQARYPDAQFSAHQAMQRFSALDAHVPIANLLCLIARLYTAQGILGRAELVFGQALRLLEKQNDAPSVARCRVGLGHTQYITGDLDSAMDTLQRALDSHQVTHGEYALTEGLEYLVQVLVYRGRWGQAIRLSMQKIDELACTVSASAVSQSIALPASQDVVHRHPASLDAALAYRTLGRVLIQIGAYDEAYAYLQRAIQTFATAEWHEALLSCLDVVGEALVGLQRYEEARDAFEQALSLGYKSNTVQTIIRAKLGLSKLAAIDKKWTEEQQLCTEARAMARKANLEVLTVDARIGLARAYLGRQEWRAAQRTALLARTSSRLRYPYNAFRAEAMLGEAVTGLGHPQRARQHFHQAGAILDLLTDALPDHYKRIFLDRPYISRIRQYASDGAAG